MERLSHALAPKAYFLSWHTYGTWLPGDCRGWDTRPATVRRGPMPALEAWCRERMRHAPVIFDRTQRALLERALQEACAHRDWPLHIAMVLPTHAHVVVSAPIGAEPALAALKSWSARQLRAVTPGLVDRPIWARHGSTRYVFDDRGVACTVRYVLDDHHVR